MSNEEEARANIEDKLSVKSFAWSQASQMLLQIGGGVVGFFAGKGISNIGTLAERTGKWVKSMPYLEKMLEDSTNKEAGKHGITAIGTLVGLTIGGVASLYRHWRRGESERLAVEEINKDMASLMSKRVETENMLQKQGAEVEKLLHEAQKHASPVHATAAVEEKKPTHDVTVHKDVTEHKDMHATKEHEHIEHAHKEGGMADKFATKPGGSHLAAAEHSKALAGERRI